MSLKELASLAPWNWDPQAAKHPPKKAALQDFEKIESAWRHDDSASQTLAAAPTPRKRRRSTVLSAANNSTDVGWETPTASVARKAASADRARSLLKRKAAELQTPDSQKPQAPQQRLSCNQARDRAHDLRDAASNAPRVGAAVTQPAAPDAAQGRGQQQSTTAPPPPPLAVAEAAAGDTAVTFARLGAVSADPERASHTVWGNADEAAPAVGQTPVPMQRDLSMRPPRWTAAGARGPTVQLEPSPASGGSAPFASVVPPGKTPTTGGDRLGYGGGVVAAVPLRSWDGTPVTSAQVPPAEQCSGQQDTQQTDVPAQQQVPCSPRGLTAYGDGTQSGAANKILAAAATADSTRGALSMAATPSTVGPGTAGRTGDQGSTDSFGAATMSMRSGRSRAGAVDARPTAAPSVENPGSTPITEHKGVPQRRRRGDTHLLWSDTGPATTALGATHVGIIDGRTPYSCGSGDRSYPSPVPKRPSTTACIAKLIPLQRQMSPFSPTQSPRFEPSPVGRQPLPLPLPPPQEQQQQRLDHYTKGGGENAPATAAAAAATGFCLESALPAVAAPPPSLLKLTPKAHRRFVLHGAVVEAVSSAQPCPRNSSSSTDSPSGAPLPSPSTIGTTTATAATVMKTTTRLTPMLQQPSARLQEDGRDWDSAAVPVPGECHLLKDQDQGHAISVVADRAAPRWQAIATATPHEAVPQQAPGRAAATAATAAAAGQQLHDSYGFGTCGRQQASASPPQRSRFPLAARQDSQLMGSAPFRARNAPEIAAAAGGASTGKVARLPPPYCVAGGAAARTWELANQGATATVGPAARAGAPMASRTLATTTAAAAVAGAPATCSIVVSSATGISRSAAGQAGSRHGDLGSIDRAAVQRTASLASGRMASRTRVPTAATMEVPPLGPMGRPSDSISAGVAANESEQIFGPRLAARGYGQVPEAEGKYGGKENGKEEEEEEEEGQKAAAADGDVVGGGGGRGWLKERRPSKRQDVETKAKAADKEEKVDAVMAAAPQAQAAMEPLVPQSHPQQPEEFMRDTQPFTSTASAVAAAATVTAAATDGDPAGGAAASREPAATGTKSIADEAVVAAPPSVAVAVEKVADDGAACTPGLECSEPALPPVTLTQQQLLVLDQLLTFFRATGCRHPSAMTAAELVAAISSFCQSVGIPLVASNIQTLASWLGTLLALEKPVKAYAQAQALAMARARAQQQSQSADAVTRAQSLPPPPPPLPAMPQQPPQLQQLLRNESSSPSTPPPPMPQQQEEQLQAVTAPHNGGSEPSTGGSAAAAATDAGAAISSESHPGSNDGEGEGAAAPGGRVCSPLPPVEEVPPGAVRERRAEEEEKGLPPRTGQEQQKQPQPPPPGSPARSHVSRCLTPPLMLSQQQQRQQQQQPGTGGKVREAAAMEAGGRGVSGSSGITSSTPGPLAILPLEPALPLQPTPLESLASEWFSPLSPAVTELYERLASCQKALRNAMLSVAAAESQGTLWYTSQRQPSTGSTAAFARPTEAAAAAVSAPTVAAAGGVAAADGCLSSGGAQQPASSKPPPPVIAQQLQLLLARQQHSQQPQPNQQPQSQQVDGKAASKSAAAGSAGVLEAGVGSAEAAAAVTGTAPATTWAAGTGATGLAAAPMASDSSMVWMQQPQPQQAQPQQYLAPGAASTGVELLASSCSGDAGDGGRGGDAARSGCDRHDPWSGVMALRPPASMESAKPPPLAALPPAVGGLTGATTNVPSTRDGRYALGTQQQQPLREPPPPAPPQMQRIAAAASQPYGSFGPVSSMSAAMPLPCWSVRQGPQRWPASSGAKGVPGPAVATADAVAAAAAAASGPVSQTAMQSLARTQGLVQGQGPPADIATELPATARRISMSSDASASAAAAAAAARFMHTPHAPYGTVAAAAANKAQSAPKATPPEAFLYNTYDMPSARGVQLPLSAPPAVTSAQPGPYARPPGTSAAEEASMLQPSPVPRLPPPTGHAGAAAVPYPHAMGPYGYMSAAAGLAWHYAGSYGWCSSYGSRGRAAAASEPGEPFAYSYTPRGPAAPYARSAAGAVNGGSMQGGVQAGAMGGVAAAAAPGSHLGSAAEYEVMPRMLPLPPPLQQQQQQMAYAAAKTANRRPKPPGFAWSMHGYAPTSGQAPYSHVSPGSYPARQRKGVPGWGVAG